MAFIGSHHAWERMSVQSSPLKPPSADGERPSSASSQVLRPWEVTHWDTSFLQIYDVTLRQIQDAVTMATDILQDSDCW
jgi:hypothetical protein